MTFALAVDKFTAVFVVEAIEEMRAGKGEPADLVFGKLFRRLFRVSRHIATSFRACVKTNIKAAEQRNNGSPTFRFAPRGVCCSLDIEPA